MRFVYCLLSPQRCKGGYCPMRRNPMTAPAGTIAIGERSKSELTHDRQVDSVEFELVMGSLAVESTVRIPHG